ncbi:MAG: hypothetical protein SH868_08220 [Bythopirellula sp.]|nr:hypothetical protein [Bythopirellula sp.]
MTDSHTITPAKQRRFSRRWQIAALLTILLLATGCGESRPARVTVSGHVLIDGQPLTVGNIKFVPDGARPSSGKLDAEGKFTLTCYDGGDGVVPGRHRAQISAMEVISASKVRWMAPPKYADFRTSELEFEINEPTDDLKIELTWDGGKPFVQ